MPADGKDMGKSAVADVLADLDLAASANMASEYMGRLDLTRVTVAGTSCGELQALQAAADPRIETVICLHTGFFSDDRAPAIGQATSRARMESAAHAGALHPRRPARCRL